MHSKFDNSCPFCRVGDLIVVQDIGSKGYSIMCDECESEWSSPETCDKNNAALPRRESRVRDATQEEIRNLGWTRFYKEDI